MEPLAVSPNEEIEQLERQLLQLPQEECPVRHSFAPGCYLRTITMRAGLFIIGAEHKTEHFNIVHTGRALVMMNGTVHEIKAPAVFVSKPGVRKVLRILETMEWSTVHVTEETDLAKIEAETIAKTPAALEYANDMKKLTEYADQRGNS